MVRANRVPIGHATLEIRRFQYTRQRPAGVIVDVGGEADFRAGAQDACETFQHSVREKTAFALAPLRPGVRIKQIGAGEASVVAMHR